MSSRCPASSSIMYRGRSAPPVCCACSRTRVVQSWRLFIRPPALGILDAGHLAERRHEPAPVLALIRKDAAARFGDPVITTAPRAGFLDPSPLDPAAILEPVQGRVQRREGEPEAAVRALLNQLRDLVTVMA